jgi:archaemetzincin
VKQPSLRACFALALALCACEPRDAEQVEPEPTPPVVRQRVASEATAPKPEPEPAPEPEPSQRVRAKVMLVPLGEFPEDLFVAVEQALQSQLDVEVVRHEVVALPDEAYYPPRKRYRAEKLLDFLEGFADEAGGDVKILGLTKVDISTTGDDVPDWGIFGLGSCPGRTAVISSKRLERRPRNREHVRFRVSNVAVHEVGHTFGLPHCDEKEVECVMLDAEGGIENTDTSSGKLGPGCSKKLDMLTVFGP